MARLLTFLLVLVPLQVCSQSVRSPEYPLPADLAPWVPWALEGDDRRRCPVTMDQGIRLCAWPGRLHLDLDGSGGLFAQRWAVQARSWVPLPGGAEHWPQDVRIGEEGVAVGAHEGLPAVRLGPGDYAINGRFAWSRAPQGLPIPRQVALMELRLDGQTVPFPRIEADGRLWLGEGGADDLDARHETLGLTVYRRVEDDNPLRVVTRLEIDAAGRGREVTLGPVLLAGGVPLGLSSPVPARLEPDGRLRLQVRPGRWVVEVTAYHSGPVEGLSLGSHAAPWPDEEVWVFAAHPELRQVEVSGASAVDPRQTRLPPEWKRLPAYLLRPGGSLQLDQLRRGDEDPAPDRLSLTRDLWLDFDGGGYTLRDRIDGELTRSWRLEVTEPLQLGRVEEGGSPRFITRLADSRPEGLEVRQGQLDLVAESRIDGATRSLPAAGWALDFQSQETRLNLPPGWRLLAVTGVDNLPDTWLNRWTLLDLFLVLLIAIGAWRLWGPIWGVAALAAVVLTWHEPGAPRLIWLNLLAAAALLRLLPFQPDGTALARMRRFLVFYHRSSLAALGLLALPFLVDQARVAIYPQLERPGAIASQGGGIGAVPAPAPAGLVRSDAAGTRASMVDDALSTVARKGVAKAVSAPSPARVGRMDPDALVQTGPGVPDWVWTQVRLSWSGPVPQDHRIGLWLVSPRVGPVLAFLRIALVLLLGLKVAGLSASVLKRIPAAAALLCAVGLTGLPGPADAQGFPSPELLADLRGRLLEPPVCLPDCADIARMDLRTQGDELLLDLTVSALDSVAVPIPGAASSWTPVSVTLEGEPMDGLFRREDGGFLVALPKGRWRVGLRGPLPRRAQVEIPLPLRPHLVAADAPGYRIQGIDENGRPGSQIQLVRLKGAAGQGESALEPAEIPPLVRIVRTLHLGVDWRLETRVSRLSPPLFPLVLEVPLLSGEKVLREDARVRDGGLLVNFAAGQRQMDWTSSLVPVERIDLRAAGDPRLSEAWRVDVSPLWHLDVEGVPVIHHQGQVDRWLPTWRPWPGEQVALLLSRPVGVPGPTLTLSGSEYRIAPGRRSADVSLKATLLSSQGGRHRIRLPDGADLTGVKIDGRERPLRLEGGGLTLPLLPATQQVDIRWRQPDALGLRYAPQPPDLGISGVNAHLRMELGRDRWVLFAGGPALGPAVLFWGLAVVLVLVAVGLGRSRLTPLRSWDWLLLGLGLSQAGVWTGLLVAGWLFALGVRSRLDRDLAPWRFNLMQAGLALLSLAALAVLIGAVEQGLMGLPEMQIAGNGSSAGRLNWYQDRSDPLLPQIWVVSVPMLVYRGLMLAWALWLAFQLIAWLRWGWQGFSRPVLWREIKLRLPERRRPAGQGPT